MSEKNSGIYIHIPYCKSRCDYCSFVSSSDCGNMKLYVDALLREMRQRGNKKTFADTVYVGGGTPSMLHRGALTRILKEVRDAFTVSSDAEITVECNPDSANGGFFVECAAAGVNRISVGLQSSDDNLLRSVNRAHTFSQFKRAINTAKACGINNISADLMLGLPAQRMEQVERSIDEVLSMDIKHVSVYGLTVEENTPLYERGYVPDEDLCAEMYGLCVKRLKEGGLNRYEVSNFAKTGYHSHHNMKYWTGAPYTGLGVAAHSYDGTMRLENTSNIAKYVTGSTLHQQIPLSRKDRMEERIMLSLRTSSGLDLAAFKKEFNTDLQLSRSEQIRRLLDLNLIEIDADVMRLCENAYYLMNEVIVSLI